MAKRTQKKDVSSKNLITIVLIIAAAFLISGNGLTGAFSWGDIANTFRQPYIPPQPVVVPQPTTTETMMPSTTDASRVGIGSSVGVNIASCTSITQIEEGLRGYASTIPGVEGFKLVAEFDEEGTLGKAEPMKLKCFCKSKGQGVCSSETCEFAGATEGQWFGPDALWANGKKISDIGVCGTVCLGAGDVGGAWCTNYC